MPAIGNAKHERFAQGLAKGLSASEAYVEAGYKESRSAASRLSTNVNIAARVAELQSRAADKVVVTIEDIARQLDEDRDFARKCGSASASVAATMGKAKVLGLIVEKQDHTSSDGSMTPTRIELVALAPNVDSTD